jgi:hypothetical protein
MRMSDGKTTTARVLEYLRLPLLLANVALSLRLGVMVAPAPVVPAHILFASASERRNGVASLDADSRKETFHSIGVHLPLVIKAH